MSALGIGSAELRRLQQDASRESNWKRWGPYLSERQWGTVREDYSEWGACWDYFTHDHSRSRAYRWGEDGLLGITDRECRLCFGLSLWNTHCPILKERLFGLTGPQGVHGEDCKECYYYLDSTPTHSYMRALYKYPHAAYPYQDLLSRNAGTKKAQAESELVDTGVFEENRYFDVIAEYAKNSANDILIRLTVANRADVAAPLHVLPNLWFRNTWSWGCDHEGCWPKPRMLWKGAGAAVLTEHITLGRFLFSADVGPDGNLPDILFTENETNFERIYGSASAGPYRKDAFHEYVIQGNSAAVNPKKFGTKLAPHYQFMVPAGGEVVLRMRLYAEDATPANLFGTDFEEVVALRRQEADAFYDQKLPATATPEERLVIRQADAGLLWTKQFYHYIIKDWIDGDAGQPPVSERRKQGRNHDWRHLFNRDVISMPDKWEYPWYAAWDLAFHMIPFAQLDPDFAKEQLLLFLREWYMHPNGQLPAYEFALGDVNPPVHAWACWRVYKMTGPKQQRDRRFLARTFQKLLINFTWWVNRKDPRGKNLFAGGFLGLDNIGIFDRSQPLPTGGFLEQADGTAWMAFYCTTMLAMALELATEDPVYEDLASKFFEHFVAIADAMNTLGGTGLWDELDGFYYDHLHVNGVATPLRIRSMVGIIPLYAVNVLDESVIEKLPGFRRRMNWFLENRPDLAKHISCLDRDGAGTEHSLHRLLAIPTRERLERMLKYVLDENEFLSPYGIRALSRVHADHPFKLFVGGQEHRVDYSPGESNTELFGGNSNWRGPIWFPVNFLVIEALERYHHFYGDTFRIECPTGSGKFMNLLEVSQEIARRLALIFLPNAHGQRPCHGTEARYATDPHWKDLVLFYEYFHGDNARGLGASHQTGWTALASTLLSDLAQKRS